jgi:hypothetical protein
MNPTRRTFRCLMVVQSMVILTVQLFVGNAFSTDMSSLASAAATQKRRVNVRLHQRQVVGAERVLRVVQGEIVEIHWTTDEEISLHLHGYDIEMTVKPDAPAIMSLEASATGRFPITSHSLGGHAPEPGPMQLKKPGENVLLYLEVHPR